MRWPYINKYRGTSHPSERRHLEANRPGQHYDVKHLPNELYD